MLIIFALLMMIALAIYAIKMGERHCAYFLIIGTILALIVGVSVSVNRPKLTAYELEMERVEQTLDEIIIEFKKKETSK